MFTVFSLQAQKKREVKPMVGPAYRGTTVSVDVLSPFMGLAVNKSVFNLQAIADVNIYNRFFPTFEFGYGSIDQTIENGATYAASAPYWRIGMDFNITGIPDKADKPALLRHYGYLGLRYGMSVVDYHMTNVPYYDYFWQEQATTNFSGIATYAGWAELIAGVKLDMVSGFTMGWSVSYKGLLHTSAPSKNYVWYVPGYGKSATTNFTCRYSIGYTFYYKKKEIKQPIIQP